ncbi:malate dehydrogenase-like [Diorhabda carinulata]|uniref:malate dehydrogenase-like n=1 Tax=Diorhabda carinulata TaxID=1163345 RepID=UPI0025A28781|nr:malate dehydrogenase-like [Diorhabda carinulata]
MHYKVIFPKVLFPVALVRVPSRCFSGSRRNNYQVTVIGGAGGIGQPLSMLLKINRMITKLHICDIAKFIPGVAVDLSHIETPSVVKGFKSPEQLGDALEGADIVIMPAGVPRKPGMTRDDLFKINAGLVKSIMEQIAASAPKALVAIITNPVNSVVPIACETMKKAGVLDPNRIFGVTTLDTVRANTFIAEAKGLNPYEVKVPVIGGHSGVTIIPLISRTTPKVSFNEEEIKKLTVRIQEAGSEVVEAKAGAGSATLSMAYAGVRFANSLLRGLSGEKNVIESAYVMSQVTSLPYFATPLVLGKCGIEKNLGLGELNCFEKNLLDKAISVLKKNIDAGIEFANLPECKKEHMS